MPFVRPYAAACLIGLIATMLAAQVNAQQIFRIVGPDGRVTFSDKPPADTSAKLAPAMPLSAGGAEAGLPFELRQVASKYPVTLYTSNNCGACGSGRAYLTSRGVPFAEKTISTPQDAEALKRIAGESLVPLLTIGGQQIRGYSDAEWAQFLDAAGYPSRSALPATWRNPAASPLVAVERPLSASARAGTDSEAARREINQPPTPAESGDNPAGIKF